MKDLEHELGRLSAQMEALEAGMIEAAKRQDATMLKLNTIELALAERRGVERVAYWLAAMVGGLAVSIATHFPWASFWKGHG